MNDAVIVGSGINSLACAALLARAGWEVRVLEREEVIGGADPDRRADRARLPARRLQCLAPALGRRGRARRARRRARRPRARVPEHGPADRDRVPGRRVCVPAPHRRGERRRARRGLGRAAGVVLPERGPRLRDPRHRALVEGRPLARAQGLPAARAARTGRLRRRPGDLEPGLADGHLRVRADPRSPRALGTAHRSRSRRRRLRLHDAGDRGRRPGGRHADPARRRSEARRGTRPADPRPRWRGRDGAGRRPGARRRWGDARRAARGR